MNILFFLLAFVGIIILIVLFSVLGFIRSLLSIIFGFGKNNRSQSTETRENTQQSQKNHKKVFEQTEGEYVDFEEIK